MWFPDISKKFIAEAEKMAKDSLSGFSKQPDYDSFYDGDGNISDSEKDENFKRGYTSATERCIYDTDIHEDSLAKFILSPVMMALGGYTTLSGTEENKAAGYQFIGCGLANLLHPFAPIIALQA